VLLCDLLNTLDNLLVDFVFALVDKRFEEFIGFGALARTVGPRPGQGAAGDGRPRY
jgi:hypothetical protein